MIVRKRLAACLGPRASTYKIANSDSSLINVRTSPRIPESASFGLVDRSKRMQRFICLWRTLIAPTPREASTLRIPTACLVRSLVVRMLCSIVPWRCCLPRIRVPAGTVFSCRNANAENRNSAYLCTHWHIRFTYMPSFEAPWTQRSELGRKIPVDFEADAHFDECWSCP
jgi:hypothetical protein